MRKRGERRLNLVFGGAGDEEGEDCLHYEQHAGNVVKWKSESWAGMRR